MALRRFNCRWLILLLYLVLLTLSNAVSVGQAGEGKQTENVGILKGKVTDKRGNVILNSTITVWNDLHVIKTEADLNGQFEFRLDPGIYEITSEIPG